MTFLESKNNPLICWAAPGTKDAWGHTLQGGWYFWNETYSDLIGPYKDEIAAGKALDGYAEYLDAQ